MPKSMSAKREADQFHPRQTSQALIAIIKYNVVHTGAKIQFGGVHSGRFSWEYQVFTEELVTSDPIPAAVKQTTTNGSNDTHDSRLNIRTYPQDSVTAASRRRTRKCSSERGAKMLYGGIEVDPSAASCAKSARPVFIS